MTHGWILRDARVGLRRSPGFAATAILMLAVGIGAVTSISYGFWQRAYGGDPNVLGRVTSIRGQSSR